MRIALISETFLPDINGVTTTLCRLLEYLQFEGHQTLLLAPHGAPPTYADAEIVPLGGMPLPFYPEVRLTPPQFGMTAHLRRFRPDLLHLVSPVMLGVAGTHVARNLRLPLISSYHTNLGDYSKHYGLGFLRDSVNTYLRWVHNHCRMTLCPSHTTLHELRRHGFRRLKVWGRGVDTSRFHPDQRSAAWRAAVGMQPGELLLLYVGRLAREKRIELLADALRDLSGVRLVLVGDGPARCELQQRMAGLPVSFMGYLRGTELATAYASADIFVFPSDTETFGQVVQEAMASGLPVVGARSGGTLDLIQDGHTGFLFEPRLASDLRARLRHLIANDSLRLAMGQAGRDAAELRSWSHVLEQLMHYYDRVLRRMPGRRYIRQAV